MSTPNLFESKFKSVLSESVNHLGETEYSSYASWLRALKLKYPAGLKIDGDRDIAGASVDGKFVGEWDGAVGSITNKNITVSEALDDTDTDTDIATEDEDTVAWRRTLDDNTKPEDFDVASNPKHSISKQNLEIAKQWVDKIEKFKRFINGLDPTSLAVQLNKMDRDGSVFRGIVKQESKRLIKIAEGLGGFNEILKSYIIGAEKKSRDLQAQASKS